MGTSRFVAATYPAGAVSPAGGGLPLPPPQAAARAASNTTIRVGGKVRIESSFQRKQALEA
jgi:hypothetical protein